MLFILFKIIGTGNIDNGHNLYATGFKNCFNGTDCSTAL